MQVVRDSAGMLPTPTSNPVVELLAFLGIARGPTRPHVSNDNAVGYHTRRRSITATAAEFGPSGPTPSTRPTPPSPPDPGMADRDLRAPHRRLESPSARLAAGR